MAEVLGGTISLRTFRILVERMRPGNALDLERGVTVPDNHVLLNIESRLRDLYALTVNMNRDKGTPVFTVPYLLAPDDDEQRLADDLDAETMADLDELWFPTS